MCYGGIRDNWNNGKLSGNGIVVSTPHWLARPPFQFGCWQFYEDELALLIHQWLVDLGVDEPNEYVVGGEPGQASMIQQIEVIADGFDFAGSIRYFDFIVGDQFLPSFRNRQRRDEQHPIIGHRHNFIQMKTYRDYTSLRSFYLDLSAFSIAQVRQHVYCAVVGANYKLCPICTHIEAVDILPILRTDL